MRYKATIKDIARELGISTSTVSRALSDKWDVSADTRERVLQMAKQLNYHPNRLAKGLSTRQTRTIGVVLPEFGTAFFPRVVMGIQDELLKHDYQMLITQSNESTIEEAKNLQLLANNQVEGIIMSVTSEGSNQALYQEIINQGIPMVFFNRICCPLDVFKVIIDDAVMAAEMVSHAVSRGCKQIAYLVGPESISVTPDRLAGYKQGLTNMHLPYDERYVIEAGATIEGGYETMQELLKLDVLPDAVCCFNDPVAIGAMKAIKQAGLRIPEDIAVSGFSNSNMASVVEPALTSVAQPTFEMGQRAAQLMMHELTYKSEGREVAHRTERLHAKIEIRESC